MVKDNPATVNYRSMLKEFRESMVVRLNREMPGMIQEEIKPLASTIARTMISFIAFDNGDLDIPRTLETCARLDLHTRRCDAGKKAYLSCCYTNGCSHYLATSELVDQMFEEAAKTNQTHVVMEWLEGQQ